MQHAIARTPNLMQRYPVRNVYVTNVASQVSTRHPLTPIRRTMWGPLLWKTMHSFGRVLKEIPDPDLRNTLTKEVSLLFDLLIRSIPCPSCRNHATHYKHTHKIEDSKGKADSFEEWAYIFHNEVNRRIQKIMISREQANKMYISTDPLQTLNDYLTSINAKTRHGVNEEQIRSRAKSILDRITN
jgi:hypothetical protein